MNARDRKTTLAIKRDLGHLYEALGYETREELELRPIALTADLEQPLSKVYCSGLCDKGKKL